MNTKEQNQYHHGDLRRAVQQEALRIIEEEGLQAVSMRAISRRLGVSPGAPYHHFADKTALLVSVAADAFSAIHAELLASRDAAPDSPYDRLAAVCRCAITFLGEQPGRLNLMFGPHMEELETYPEVWDAGHPTRLLLGDAVAECIGEDAENGKEVERAVWAMIHGFASLVSINKLQRDGGFESVERSVSVALDLLFSGIRAEYGRPDSH